MKHGDTANCFSCESDFILEEANDRDEGYFCDECIDMGNHRLSLCCGVEMYDDYDICPECKEHC